MSKLDESGLALTVTATYFILLGLGLVIGGVWLVRTYSLPFYASAGSGFAITGVLLLHRMRAALWAFSAVLLGTSSWTVTNVRLDWSPLSTRVDLIFLLALWLLTPWISGNLDRGPPISKRRAVMPLWLSLAASAAVLVSTLEPGYHDIAGPMPTVTAAPGSFGRLLSDAPTGN